MRTSSRHRTGTEAEKTLTASSFAGVGTNSTVQGNGVVEPPPHTALCFNSRHPRTEPESWCRQIGPRRLPTRRLSRPGAYRFLRRQLVLATTPSIAQFSLRQIPLPQNLAPLKPHRCI